MQTMGPHGSRCRWEGDAERCCPDIRAALMPVGWDGDKRGMLHWLVEEGGGCRSTPQRQKSQLCMGALSCAERKGQTALG